MTKLQKTKEEILAELKNSGHGKIAMRIELIWGYPELLEYLGKLIITNREGRQGFDLETFSNLLKLFHLHEKEFPEIIP